VSEPGAPGPAFSIKVPEGDNRQRLVCDRCGFVDYVNPRIVVGAVCAWKDGILLCRRAIEPRKGFWTIPAGFLEEKETLEQGAMREALEEARADIEIGPLLGAYSVPRISQVQMVFRARLRSPDVGPGEESLEVRLLAWEEIPWGELSFPSVRSALRRFHAVRGLAEFAPEVRTLSGWEDPPAL
jgi:ADP-ribose pyrophosphatase YjhB (NUDIX family)